MAELVNMPKLGFDMQEGQLIAWRKNPGDEVKHGDVLAEIESDKATVEVESYVEGVMLQQLVEAGSWVPIGAPIAVVGQAGEQVDLAALGVQGAAAEQAPASKLGPQAASAQQSPSEVEAAAAPRAESGQANAAAPKPAGQRQDTSGAPAEIGQGRRDTDGRRTPPKAPEGNGHATLPDGVRASPLARRVAREKGVDLGRIEGSGPQGRITRADVENYQRALAEGPAAAAVAPATAQRPQVAVQPMEGDETIETPRMRRRIGQRMVESKTTVPHFYVTTEIDMGPVLDLRAELNRRLEKEGSKISVNDLIVKAVALALKDFPNVNSSFNGDRIIRRRRINVGIAVAVENGLLNVVSREADKTPLTVMAKTHAEMIGRAREGKVKPEDVEGETIAVSNLGAYEVDHFIAIINPPAAAIVAVGSAKQVPIVKDGELAVGWRMKATVSADHRVTDGAEAAQYLQRVKEILEDPLRLLM